MADLQFQEDRSTGSLIRDVLDNTQRLFRQEIALAKTEVKQEWTKGKRVIGYGAVAGVTLGLTALFLCFTAVYVLQALGLQLWASYAMVTVVLGGVGTIFLMTSRKEANDLNVIPQETVETMREDVEWITKQR